MFSSLQNKDRELCFCSWGRHTLESVDLIVHVYPGDATVVWRELPAQDPALWPALPLRKGGIGAFWLALTTQHLVACPFRSRCRSDTVPMGDCDLLQGTAESKFLYMTVQLFLVLGGRCYK